MIIHQVQCLFLVEDQDLEFKKIKEFTKIKKKRSKDLRLISREKKKNIKRKKNTKNTIIINKVNKVKYHHIKKFLRIIRYRSKNKSYQIKK
jgi:hypothetical protein